MLTLFTIPKPFVGHIDVIQRNALASWAALGPDMEVVVYGDEPGTAAAAADLGLRHQPRVQRNAYGTPLLDAVFADALATARHPLVGYCNADVILLPGFVEAAAGLPLQRFLMVGQRWNARITRRLDFGDPATVPSLRRMIPWQVRLYLSSSSDYFVFPRAGGLGRLPPFAVGRPWWDNWMMYAARCQGVPLVDATRGVTALHQWHDYGHVPQGSGQDFAGPEADEHARLVAGWDHVYGLSDATHLLVRRRLVPARGWRLPLRAIERAQDALVGVLRLDQ